MDPFGFLKVDDMEYWRPYKFYPDSGYKWTPYPQTRIKDARDDFLRLGPSGTSEDHVSKTFSDLSYHSFGFDLSCKLKLTDQIRQWAVFEGDIPFGFSSTLSDYQAYETVYKMTNTDSVSHEWNEYYWDTTTDYGRGYVITFTPYVSPPPPPPPPPGGCPYVTCWNGTGYTLDNDILPASETSGGSDVWDCYVLQQPVLPELGPGSHRHYRLRLVEFETEHSWIDSVQLLMVSHPPGTTLVSDSNGQLVTISSPVPPLQAVDQDGQDRLASISEVGGAYFHGLAGDVLYLTFARPTSPSPLRLVLRADMKNPYSIEVQVPSPDGWVTYSVVHPRAMWDYEVVDMTPLAAVWDEHIEVRLVFTSEHKLDLVGLDTSTTHVLSVRSARLERAVDSNGDDVTRNLKSADGRYAELLPGYYIDLCFNVRDLPVRRSSDESCDLVFKSRGHYIFIGQEHGDCVKVSQQWLNGNAGAVACNADTARPGVTIFRNKVRPICMQ